MPSLKDSLMRVAEHLYIYDSARIKDLSHSIPDADSHYSDILARAFNKFIDVLPPILNVGNESPFTAKLGTFITTFKPIELILWEFKRNEPLFSTLWSIYDRNWKTAQEDIESGKYVLDSPEYMERLLKNTPLEGLLNIDVPISIPSRSRFEGTWIVAPPGRGKTTLLSNLLGKDLAKVVAGHASVIIMDSKGDLSEHVRRLNMFSPQGDLAGKLTFIEPNASLALNPLDLGASTAHTITLIEYVFSSLLETKTTPKQATLFRSVLTAVKAIPGATFTTLSSFLRDGWKPYARYIETLRTDDREFFELGEYDTRTYAETKQELLWRIRNLTTKVPLLRDIFHSPSTKIDIGAEMDAGKVIIIDNSVAILGEGAEFFSRFFVALILAAAQQRATRLHGVKMPVYFYIDECQDVIARDSSIATILQTCRSQMIAMTFAHQEIQQIKSDDVKGALANCAIKIANSDEEASQLASRLRTTPEFLRGLKRGQFGLFVRDYTPNAITLNVPNNPVSRWTKMPDFQFNALRAEMRARYSYTPIEPPPPTNPHNEPTPEKW